MDLFPHKARDFCFFVGIQVRLAGHLSSCQRNMGQVNSSTIVFSLFLSSIASALYLVCTYIFRRTKLSIIPGPPNPNILLGRMPEIRRSEQPPEPELWIKEYGPVIKFHGLLSVRHYCLSESFPKN
jgi:hypothetical protein